METIQGFAVIIGWPTLTLTALIALVAFAPRGMAWRAGSIIVALGAAAGLIFTDYAEKGQTHAKHDNLRNHARRAVIEQRSDDIEAKRARKVIAVLAREVMSDTQELTFLLDSALAYDPALEKVYIDAVLASATPERNPFFAARDGLNVFVTLWRAGLPTARDNVIHFIAKDYERIFTGLKDSQPQACAGYMTGKGLLNTEAKFELYRAVGASFRTMADKTWPISKGTKADAITFAERVLGRERLTELLELKQPFADTCDDLAMIFAAVHADESPAAYAAARHWMKASELLP